MSNLSQSAQTLFQIASGQTVSDQDFVASLTTLRHFGGHTTADQHKMLSMKPALCQLFSSQKRTPEIVQKWRSRFINLVSTEQAKQFIRELFGAIEDTQALITQTIVTGTTITEKGEYSDYAVYRPYKKLGWTIHITSSGAGDYNCLRKRIRSKPGDLFLFAPDSHFNYQRHNDCDHWHHHWAIFQPEKNWLLWLQWPEVGPGIFHLDIDSQSTRTQLLSLFNEITRLWDHLDPIEVELKKNLLEQILLRCCQHLPQKQPPVDERIGRAMGLIGSHYNQSLSINDIADQVGLSALHTI